ncbi:hypothetical protein J6590_052261 [Homalodisca vitripennis]|nr:hypothetical protein J6590_052261 [Homalodisca vitripennis]
MKGLHLYLHKKKCIQYVSPIQKKVRFSIRLNYDEYDHGNLQLHKTIIFFRVSEFDLKPAPELLKLCKWHLHYTASEVDRGLAFDEAKRTLTDCISTCVLKERTETALCSGCENAAHNESSYQTKKVRRVYFSEACSW